MGCFRIRVLGIVLAACLVGRAAHGQNVPLQSVSSPSPGTPSTAGPAPSATAVEPGTPSPNIVDPTVRDTTVGDTTVDPARLLPDLPSLHSGKMSLIGGTIVKLDRVRDQITLQVFGGGKMKIFFDPRTHIYNEGNEASFSDLRSGDQVSIDTTLDGSTIFARNIRLRSAASGESEGIVVSYRNGNENQNGELLLRDRLSPLPIKLRVTSQTRFVEQDHPTSAGVLVRGTLVAAKFGRQKDGSAVALEVSVLAIPGLSFTFVGQVATLDLRDGLLVLTSATDGKTYEIYLDPSAANGDENLRPASDVTVVASFDGERYVAHKVTVK